MLQKWVGTSEGPRYAAQVAGNAGVNLNAKVSSLSDAQLQQLQMAKVQKESTGLYKLLQSQTAKPAQQQSSISSQQSFSQQSIPQFQNYLTTGKIGTSAEEVKAINAEFGSVAEFKRQAEAYNNSAN